MLQGHDGGGHDCNGIFRFDANEAGHITAFGQIDANADSSQIRGVNLMQFFAQVNSATAHDAVFDGRVVGGTSEGFDANTELTQLASLAGNFHLADVAQKIAELVGAHEGRALQHLFKGFTFFPGIGRDGCHGHSLTASRRIGYSSKHGTLSAAWDCQRVSWLILMD